MRVNSRDTFTSQALISPPAEALVSFLLSIEWVNVVKITHVSGLPTYLWMYEDTSWSNFHQIEFNNSKNEKSEPLIRSSTKHYWPKIEVTFQCRWGYQWCYFSKHSYGHFSGLLVWLFLHYLEIKWSDSTQSRSKFIFRIMIFKFFNCVIKHQSRLYPKQPLPAIYWKYFHLLCSQLGPSSLKNC